jgi:8-oxo-dGTP pyrophosphatase MutT (NUDIX family)
MKRFNIRVYGIWINDKQEILVSDERIGDFKFTKFPGGGLEFGEGIKDCLIREWKEELNIDIEVGNHIYTTDFFQLSAFDQTSQIISIYYNVRPMDAKPLIDLRERVFDFHGNGHEEITFRQLPLQQFSAMDVSLPIDKIVATLITK